MWWVPAFEAGLAALEVLIGIERANKLCLLLITSPVAQNFAALLVEGATPMQAPVAKHLATRIIGATNVTEVSAMKAKDLQGLMSGIQAMAGNRVAYNQAFTNYLRKNGRIPNVAAGVPLLVQSGMVRLGPESLEVLMRHGKSSWEIMAEGSQWVIRTKKLPSANGGNVVTSIANVPMVRTDAALAARLEQLFLDPKIARHL